MRTPKKIAALTTTLFAIAIVSMPSVASANSALLQWVPVDPTRINQVSQGIALKHGTRTWNVPAAKAKLFFKTKAVDGQTMMQLRPGAIYDYLNIYVSPRVNDLGESSRFKYIGGNLHLLEGGRKGKIVDGVKTSLAIRSAIQNGQSTVGVSMKSYRPGVFSAEDFKKLSFPDLLARGESNFAGSPSNRRHNIAVATSKYDGLVLMPGEQFSFNQYLGAVDAANGYLPELVIKENVTTPEYGGGICQVSTTAFRAGLQAGLRIDERYNHSYPVAYYGAPGYDATIYSPGKDLKYTNDTGFPVYMTTQINGNQLVFNMHGTKNGREVRINGPFTTKKNPDGSLTAAIAQYVTQNGKTIREKNFVSNYQSADKFPTIRDANGG